MFLHPKITASMTDELVEFFKRPLIEEQINSLSYAELAFGMLPIPPFFAATVLSIGVSTAQFFESVFRHCDYVFFARNSRSHFTLASRSSRSRCACCSFGGGGAGLRTSPLSTSATKRLKSLAGTPSYPVQNFGSK